MTCMFSLLASAHLEKAFSDENEFGFPDNADVEILSTRLNSCSLPKGKYLPYGTFFRQKYFPYIPSNVRKDFRQS
jgi:hypothetical protein